PSILLVVAGTFAVATVSFSLQEIVRAQKVMFKTLFYHLADPSDAAIEMLQLSERARKEGVLALQQSLDQLEDKPFLHHALVMVVDGTSVDDVDRIMRSEIAAMAGRHIRSGLVFRRSAEIAPAMGLIGTLVGLVQMLANLSDPANIGPAMAVALMTTFYGAVLANMVFTPISTKLERNSQEEMLVNQIHLLGAVSIGRQENPRRLELLLNTLLPPSKRVSYFD
ncbi:MAG: flagellar motor protein MotA, partial [Alphaproteobacteria bacterium]|nr:flagellar motor protein MotA [Alphaproteobacteria bacterium]